MDYAMIAAGAADILAATMPWSARTQVRPWMRLWDVFLAALGGIVIGIGI